MTQEIEEKAVAVQRLHEEAFNALGEARKKDAKYYRNELDRVNLEKAKTVLAAEELQGEVKSLQVELNSMRAQRDRLKREVQNLTGKLATSIRSGAENARLAELFRSHLDDRASEFFDDNEWEQQARQITWNGIDAEASRTEHCMAEGIDE